MQTVTNKLYDQNASSRQAACHLLVLLLVNPNIEVKIELNPSLPKTSEALFIHTVSDWITHISKQTNPAEVILQPEKEYPQMTG